MSHIHASFIYSWQIVYHVYNYTLWFSSLYFCYYLIKLRYFIYTKKILESPLMLLLYFFGLFICFEGNEESKKNKWLEDLVPSLSLPCVFTRAPAPPTRSAFPSAGILLFFSFHSPARPRLATAILAPCQRRELHLLSFVRSDPRSEIHATSFGDCHHRQIHDVWRLLWLGLSNPRDLDTLTATFYFPPFRKGLTLSHSYSALDLSYPLLNGC